MSDFDLLAGEFAGLNTKIKGRVLELGEGILDLTADQLKDLASLTDDMALAIAGDPRIMAHLKAELAQRKFSTEARAYLEIAKFRTAVADALLEIAGSLVSVGAKLAAEALAGALLPP